MTIRRLALAALSVALLSAAWGLASLAADSKLPKCSGQLCKGTACSPDVLCVSGSKVLSCADVCKGR